MALDVIVRGGTLVDGSGAPARAADVGVAGGRVVAVSPPGGLAEAHDEIDATGCVVTPGFVDPHTHLDAQLCWDPSGSPSPLHGVTSVVIGLCGFGVAPVGDDSGEYLLRSLEMVEEIPYESTAVGVPLAWRSWGEYFAWVGRQPLGLNVAGYVPHSALRVAVMGERARGERATDDDRRAMAAALAEALRAGAVGLASSRGPNHTDANGDPVPSRFADDDELRRLVLECRGRIWQLNVATKFSGDAEGLLAEVEGYAAWTAEADARLTWTPLFAEPGDEGWMRARDQAAALTAAGTPVTPQVCVEPISVLFRWDAFSYAAFVPGWGPLMQGFYELPVDDRLDRLADPDVRHRLRAAVDAAHPSAIFAPRAGEWLVLQSPSAPELTGRTLAEAAAERRTHPVDLLCDLLITDRLGTYVQVPALNRDPAARAALAADGATLIGLGDAGAHVMSINNFSYPTTLLSELVRDRGALPLEVAVRRISAEPAALHGLTDRGLVAEGRPADLCVIDLDRLALRPVEVVDDLPAGASRLYQRAVGYRAVVCNGVATVLDDELTGAAAGAPVAARAAAG